MPDDGAIELHVVGWTGWDTADEPRPVVDLRYVRVEDPLRYDPPPGTVAFVWEEWLILDRLEKYGSR